MLLFKFGCLEIGELCCLLATLVITRLLRLVGRLGSRKPVNHTSLVTVVTPTDRPKSVRNYCVIVVLEDFDVVTLHFGIYC